MSINLKENYFQRAYLLWLVCIVLVVGYTCVLCLQSYYSQKDLQASALTIWSEEAEKKAQLISFFLQNREDDLRRLSSSQPIAAFFDSKDLGMSLQYGLGASLDLINDHFWQLLAQVRVGDLPVYEYLTLVDAQGRLLVEAGRGQLGRAANFRFSHLLTPTRKDPFFFYWLPRKGSSGSLLISAPVFRKGRYRGQLIARINQQALAWQFRGAKDGQKEGILFLSVNDHFFCLPANKDLKSIMVRGKLSPRKVFVVNWPDATGAVQDRGVWARQGRPRQRWIGQSLAISGFASFRLYWIRPVRAVFGTSDPHDLLFGFSGVVFLVICGLFFLYRMTKKNYILQQQLQQAQKMEALGVLAGGIAHDFNNFLQGMSNINELLRLKCKEQPGLYTYLQKMKELIERASQLVCQVLAFSRRHTPMLKAVDINAEIMECRKFFLRTVPKMVTIRTDLEPGVGKIKADPVQLQQIVLNLINNALDAFGDPPQGTISIATFAKRIKRIRKGSDLQPGDYVCLQVADDGPGMPREVLEHIFDPFFTTKDVGKGTGLGLAMVYGLVRSHGGEIFCRSTPGRGTVFTLYFPRAEENGADGRDAAAEGTAFARSGQGKSLLIVDDEKVIRETAAEAMRDLGYEVHLAADGEACLEMLKGREVDLVVLDLGMPGMGGENCLYKLQSLHPGLPIIVASGYAGHRLSKDPEQYGLKAFLSKPYRLDELVRTVESVLESDKN